VVRANAAHLFVDRGQLAQQQGVLDEGSEGSDCEHWREASRVQLSTGRVQSTRPVLRGRLLCGRPEQNDPGDPRLPPDDKEHQPRGGAVRLRQGKNNLL